VTIGVDSAPRFRFVTEVHDDTSADYLFTYMEKFFCELLLPKVVIFYDDLKITHYPLPTSNVVWRVQQRQTKILCGQCTLLAHPDK